MALSETDKHIHSTHTQQQQQQQQQTNNKQIQTINKFNCMHTNKPTNTWYIQETIRDCFNGSK